MIRWIVTFEIFGALSERLSWWPILIRNEAYLKTFIRWLPGVKKIISSSEIIY